MPTLLDQVVKVIEKELEPPKPKSGHRPPKPGEMPPKMPPKEEKNISVPAYCKAIFLNSVNGDEFPKESYTASISSLFKDIDLVAFHRNLIDEELLIRPNISQILGTFSNNDLKELLKQKGLKATGSKDELIEIAVANLNADEIMKISKQNHIFVLSPKGEKYVNKYSDYIYMFKKKSKYGIDIQEYYDYTKANPDAGTFELAKLIIKEHAKGAKFSNFALADLELNKAEIYEDEMRETGKNKNKEILNAKMKYIYYSLNASEAIENLMKALEKGQEIKPPMPQPVNYFTNNALKILENDSESYINYDLNNLPIENNLPYCICPRDLTGKILFAFSKNPNCDYGKFNKPINDLERDYIMHMLPKPKGKK